MNSQNPTPPTQKSCMLITSVERFNAGDRKGEEGSGVGERWENEERQKRIRERWGTEDERGKGWRKK